MSENNEKFKKAQKSVKGQKFNKKINKTNTTCFDSVPQPKSDSQLEGMIVEQMTSRDFQRDIHAHIDVVGGLLKDEARVKTFQTAINLNKHLFRGKTVLDIGCGSGILSLFAAKAGAARIFAVDPSNVVDYTQAIVHANQYEHVIEVIKGRVEDVHLPVEQVDIIISDWMGYSLLYQTTCEAVIYARDKWLCKDGSGLIFPDEAKLYIAGMEDPVRKNDKIEWWKNVYGFNMKSIREVAIKEPSFYRVFPEQILSTDFNIMTLNLYTAKSDHLRFRSKYMIRILRSGEMDGVVTYFRVRFSKSHTPLEFNTDPWSPYTNLMQSVFFFDQPVIVNAEEILYGGFEMIPSNLEDPHLDDMEASLELYSGEPMQLQVEMHWKLKPQVVIIQSEWIPPPLLSNLKPPAIKSGSIKDINNANGENNHPVKHGSHKKNKSAKKG